jgi:hypothetical protein
MCTRGLLNPYDQSTIAKMGILPYWNLPYTLLVAGKLLKLGNILGWIEFLDITEWKAQQEVPPSVCKMTSVLARQSISGNYICIPSS